MPLHLQYRPQSLDQLYGNEAVKSAVTTILAREDRPRAWLFTGPSGCGKTTMARIIANDLGCHERDYAELNISDSRGIDDARKIMQNMAYMPQAGKVRVFVLDEIQSATGPFQQSILKALEDTPPHVVFILCTTDPDRLLKTIKTRCTTFEMKSLPGPVMRKMLGDVLSQEGVGVSPEVIEAIVQGAEGSPRQALVILDQAIDMVDDTQMLEAVQRSQGSEATIKDLCQSLLHKQSWERVSSCIKSLSEGEDWEKIRRAVLGYCGAVLLNKNDAQAATIIECFKGNLYDAGKAGFVLMAWRAIL